MIHKRLQALRKEKGFSQKDMADKLHKSPSSYSRMENGEIKIALEELPGIAALLDCTVEDLLQDMATINIQQHNENAIVEQNNHASDVAQLFDKLMEFQARQEERMQNFMKEMIRLLKH